MKILPYLFSFCSVAVLPPMAQAEPLDYQTKQELIQTLQEILRGNQSRESSAITAALDAFRPAAMDDKVAYSLYENCIKKKEFTEKDKNESEFRKWKNDNKEKSGDPAFRKALQYQFQWAVLTLQAASVSKDSFDASQYAPQIISILESIGSNYKELKNRKGELSQSILQGQVGDVYGVSQVSPEEWPGNLMDVGGIFEMLIFPKYRKDLNISGLRGAWDKRIGLEARFLETKDEGFDLPENSTGKDDNKKRKSSSSSSVSKSSSNSLMNPVKLSKQGGNSKDLTRKAYEVLQNLRWQKEVDCCKIGDESQASINMLKLIKATRDPKTREARIQELMGILIPSKKSNKGKNSRVESTPFGAESIPGEEEEIPEPRPRPKRVVREEMPSSVVPEESSRTGEAELQKDKTIIPIVEEVTSSPLPSVTEEKVVPVAEPSAPSSEKEPAPTPKEPSKVDDDFFDE